MEDPTAIRESKSKILSVFKLVENKTQLTADEEELYYRQIRLWGVESQERLRSARLLLIGLGGLGAEVAKNMVLSGIKSITLLDDKLSTKELAFSQFLIPPDKIGENRAVASMQRLQNLNPHGEVSSKTFPIAELTEEYFSKSGAIVGPEVCAIVGAVLSQEVIKAGFHKDEPRNNSFFFNHFNNKGTVLKLGKLN